MTTLMLENLHKQFARQPEPTLRGISLEVAPGEMLALLGPSGSGKSTILKLIAGIEHLDQGDIRLDGESIVQMPANQRGAVLMFQKAYLFPFMNIADNIGFGLKVQGAKRNAIRSEVGRMLELVGLPGVERKYPHQMSGGEQQRIALARALVARPRLLMLDEPLSSLDTAVRHTLQEAIRRIQRELGLTTVLVTHDLREAITMSDRIALLLDGAIEACDTPQRLFQRPPTQRAAQFVGVSTFLDGWIEGERFRSPLGELALAAPQHERHARPAMLAIRPEHLRLLAEPAPNALPGTLADVAYRGEFTEYRVQLGEEAEPVRVRSYAAQRMGESGDTCYVQFPAEWLFEVRSASAPHSPPSTPPAAAAEPRLSGSPSAEPAQ
jgi:ABC-type Fe3+/spermidine/putrescine transport system ATPase subunit